MSIAVDVPETDVESIADVIAEVEAGDKYEPKKRIVPQVVLEQSKYYMFDIYMKKTVGADARIRFPKWLWWPAETLLMEPIWMGPSIYNENEMTADVLARKKHWIETKRDRSPSKRESRSPSPLGSPKL